MEKDFGVCRLRARVGVTVHGQKFYYCPECGYKEMA